MIERSLSNAARYGVQIVFAVAASAMAARLIRVPAPGARLAYWRAVVAGCLALPLVALLKPASIAVPTIDSAMADVAAAADPIGSALAPAVSLVPILLWALAIGIALRMAWLVVGMTRLSALRRRSRPLPVDEDIDVWRRGLAPRAEFRAHEAVQQPVTFGLRRPVILVPETFTTLPVETQRAVACHELLHVRRHDWLWTLGEEMVRTGFWFHTPMRWALTQLQLAREEVVDARVVQLTGARDAYMNALMTFANRPALMPSALFAARRSHLTTRIRRIAEEVPMSNVRFVLTACALAGVLTQTRLSRRAPRAL